MQNSILNWSLKCLSLLLWTNILCFVILKYIFQQHSTTGCCECLFNLYTKTSLFFISIFMRDQKPSERAMNPYKIFAMEQFVACFFQTCDCFVIYFVGKHICITLCNLNIWLNLPSCFISKWLIKVVSKKKLFWYNADSNINWYKS